VDDRSPRGKYPVTSRGTLPWKSNGETSGSSMVACESLAWRCPPTLANGWTFWREASFLLIYFLFFGGTRHHPLLARRGGLTKVAWGCGGEDKYKLVCKDWWTARHFPKISTGTDIEGRRNVMPRQRLTVVAWATSAGQEYMC